MQKSIYGEGTFSVVKNRPKSPIRYRKRIMGSYVSVYGRSERECKKKMQEKESKLREQDKCMHPSEAAECVLLSEAMEFWLKTFKKNKLKGRSFDREVQVLNSYIKDSPIGNVAIENVQSSDLQVHLNNIALTKSQSTINKVHGMLKQFFDYYYKRDYNNNPMLTVNKPKKQVDYSQEDFGELDNNKILSDEEIALLTRELTKPYQNGVGGYKCGYMLLFIMWSYLRIGEALALTYKDVSYSSEHDVYTLRVSKEFSQEMNYETGKKEWKLTSPKSKNSVRTIPLCPQAIDCFNKYVEAYCPNIEQDTFVFLSEKGNPISLQHLNKKLKQALSNAGIKKNISLHGLRHTGISYMIRKGVDVALISRTAGHSDISTTTRIYYNIIEEQKFNMFKNHVI